MTTTALCATLIHTEGDLWFSTDPAERARAKAHCRRCPLVDGCAQAGLDLGPDARGVWGGLSSGDRRVLRTGERGPDPDNQIDGEKPRVPCGSESAFKAHRVRGEDCEACQAAHDARVEAGRREQLVAAHDAGGTEVGAAAHRRLGEQPCDLCRVAAARAQAARKTAAQGAVRLSAVPGTPGPPAASTAVLEPSVAAA